MCFAGGVTGESRRVAVVGSGISGLASAWLLHRQGVQVTLFEKEVSCGPTPSDTRRCLQSAGKRSRGFSSLAQYHVAQLTPTP